MQTEVIQLIFSQFKNNFSFFFNQCDQGFVNEAIIRMYSRRYFKQPTGRLKLVEHQYKLTELFFTLEGTFGLLHPKLKSFKGLQEMDE